MKLYARIAETLAWIDRLEEAGDKSEWKTVAESRLACMLEKLPHGSGIDGETCIRDVGWSGKGANRTVTRIVFGSDYHHMNDGGYYDGWTTHNVTVRPSWSGPDITISGRNRNDIKDYLCETWKYVLTRNTDVEGNIIST